MADLPPNPIARRQCGRANLGRLVLALSCALVLPCAAAQSKPLPVGEGAEFVLEGPVVRALLERAAAAETGRGRAADIELAATLYCRAARYGSTEAVYRLGRMVLAGRGVPRDVPMAATLFSIASGNGHYGASLMVLLTGVREERLPQCLAEPPS